MAEVIKCPNCNAQLHTAPNVNILKCEYCDTEIIINNNIQNFPKQTNEFSKQINIFPQQMNEFSKQGNNPLEEMEKWKKAFRKHLIIQTVLTAFFGIFMEADLSDIGVILFLASTVYSFVLPFYLLKDKPLSPSLNKNNNLTDIKIYISFANPNKNNKFIDFMKIYLPFAGAFWGGMILIAIIASI